MDILSEVLDTIHIKGALYFEVQAAHPWVLVNPAMNLIGSFMLPELEHVIPFHIMLEGQGWAKSDDNLIPPLKLESGDVVMFPMGSSHSLTSDINNWQGIAADTSFYQQTAAKKKPFTAVKLGQDGLRAKLVCGYIGFNAKPLNPMLKTLPKILVVKEHVSNEGLMKQLLLSTLNEMGKSNEGARNIVTKLTELIFTQALRQPFKKWSLALLANECGMSRSSFTERFNHYVGHPPMKYINCWKMQLASKLLSDGMSIVRVAEHIGYSSESAFQKAFKRYVGQTAGEWRAT